MSRLGRLLFGCTVLGVTAATVYYYLEEKEKEFVLDDDDDIFAVKGILKKSVPQWLNLPHLRAAILIYKNPSAKLGGTGALYILLRRNKNL